MTANQVKLSNGDTVNLKSLNMGDIMNDIFVSGTPWLQVVIRASTGKPWDWFLQLDLIDGAKILSALAPSVQQTMAVMQVMNFNETKH